MAPSSASPAVGQRHSNDRKRRRGSETEPEDLVDDEGDGDGGGDGDGEGGARASGQRKSPRTMEPHASGCGGGKHGTEERDSAQRDIFDVDTSDESSSSDVDVVEAASRSRASHICVDVSADVGAAETAQQSSGWACRKCTYWNDRMWLRCDMCGAPKS